MGFVRFHFMNSNSQFESIPRTSNSRGSLQSSQQYASKYQFEPLVHYSSSKESLQSLQLNSLKCKFETVAKHMNPRGFLQRAKPYSSKCQFENGSRASAFEPLAKNGIINPKKGELKTEIDETGTANEKVETKTKQKGRHEVKDKKIELTIQKLSNHIKFIDYIPTHEIITYRHLFAYGFYVE